MGAKTISSEEQADKLHFEHFLDTNQANAASQCLLCQFSKEHKPDTVVENCMAFHNSVMSERRKAYKEARGDKFFYKPDCLLHILTPLIFSFKASYIPRW